MKNKKYINSLLAACVLFSCFNSQAAELKRVYGKLSFGYGDWNKGFVNVDRGSQRLHARLRQSLHRM
ncbi:hypothetical protein ACLD4S_22675, partial [Salmonella sp. 741265064_HSA]